MTQKRFVETISTGIITDTITGKEYNCEYRVSNEFLELVNQLAKENGQLKQEYQKLKHRHSLLHDECLDIECERCSLKKDVESLEKENEQLKFDKQQLYWAMSREEVRHKQFKDKVFDLIDEKIKEYQKYDEYDTEKYYIGTQLLNELKKELLE